MMTAVFRVMLLLSFTIFLQASYEGEFDKKVVQTLNKALKAMDCYPKSYCRVPHPLSCVRLDNKNTIIPDNLDTIVPESNNKVIPIWKVACVYYIQISNQFSYSTMSAQEARERFILLNEARIAVRVLLASPSFVPLCMSPMYDRLCHDKSHICSQVVFEFIENYPCLFNELAYWYFGKTTKQKAHLLSALTNITIEKEGICSKFWKQVCDDVRMVCELSGKSDSIKGEIARRRQQITAVTKVYGVHFLSKFTDTEEYNHLESGCVKNSNHE